MPLTMSPMLYRLLAILFLWVLSGASAYASPGADCLGHASPSAARHTAVQASPLPVVLDLASLPSNPLQLQARLAPASRSADVPSLTDADDACSSCPHCAACCLSVAPPMVFRLPLLPAPAGVLFPAPGLEHRSPDMAALERPPQPVPTRKTA